MVVLISVLLFTSEKGELKEGELARLGRKLAFRPTLLLMLLLLLRLLRFRELAKLVDKLLSSIFGDVGVVVGVTD